MKNNQKYLQKVQGSLLGLACGDALGDIGRSDEFRKRYGLITNLYEGAKSTDDTEFATLVARMLVECEGNLTPDFAFLTWKTKILDQGGVFSRAGMPLYGAIANINRGLLPPLSGKYNVMNIDDGAAMRIAPIGMICPGDPERAAHLAVFDAQISHDADGIWAAQAVAASVAVAMAGGSVAEIVEIGLAQCPRDSWLRYCFEKAQKICFDCGSIEDAWELLHTELWTPSHSAAPEAIPQAYAIFLLTDGDFKKGLFWACNFGRDADTLGAVVGALTGAKNGIEVIPPDWVQKVRYPAGVSLKFAAHEDLMQLSEQLANLIQ